MTGWYSSSWKARSLEYGEGGGFPPPFSYATKQSGGDKTHRPPDTAVRLRPTKQPVCFTTERAVCDTMRMWQGASGVSPYNGIVSPAYTIVTPIRPDLHNMTFWAYYFKYSPLVQTFQKYSQGLTSDTWNLKFPQFSEIAVTMPPISEQDKIAECLSVFDEHCKCEDEKLQALLQVRTSLLQQLFI